MSRIGKKPIPLPKAVKMAINGKQVIVEGPRGKSQYTLPRSVSMTIDKESAVLTTSGTDRKSKALFGLARSLVANMVQGTSEGFIKKLEIQGVGFKAGVKGKDLNLNLGFSHPVVLPIPEGIKITVADQTGKVVPEGTFLTVEGHDKQQVGEIAAQIRRYYPVEPYKGKGVRYAGEHVIRKEGKTAQGR